MYTCTWTFLSLLLLNPFSVSGRNCYTPDGSLKKGDVPCSDSQKVVGCCGQGDNCYNGGLCFSRGNKTSIARGSCTDPNWGTGCPQACLDWPNGGKDIRLCSLDQYCCGEDCCKKGKTLTVFWKPGWFSEDSSSSTATTTSKETAKATSTASTVDGSRNAVTTTGVAEMAITEAASKESTQNVCAMTSSQTKKSPTEAAAVGAILGVALLAALGTLLWQHKRHQRVLEKMSNWSVEAYPPKQPIPMVQEKPSEGFH